MTVEHVQSPVVSSPMVEGCKQRHSEKLKADYAWCPKHNISYSRVRKYGSPVGPPTGCFLCLKERRLKERVNCE